MIILLQSEEEEKIRIEDEIIAERENKNVKEEESNFTILVHKQVNSSS